VTDMAESKPPSSLYKGFFNQTLVHKAFQIHSALDLTVPRERAREPGRAGRLAESAPDPATTLLSDKGNHTTVLLGRHSSL